MYTFNQIIGYEEEKSELKLLCDMMKHQKKYDELGVALPPALLIYGEPGLGKSLMAQALIDESGWETVKCVKDKPDGEFVSAIKEAFQSAVNKAPCILFLDDIDKFAEGDLQYNCNKEEFATIQSCMERVKNVRVFVLATANDIDLLPESLLREGRFGRTLKITPPAHKDAVEIINYYLKGKNVKAGIDIDMFANMLDGRSCAVLESVVNEAGMRAGFAGKDRIEEKDLHDAAIKIVYGLSDTLPDSLEVREALAYHEAGHAVMAHLYGRSIGFMKIYRNGGTCHIFDDSYRSIWHYEDLLKDADIGLAGKAATELFYHEIDMGCEKDIEDVAIILRNCLEKSASEGFEYTYDLSIYYSKQAPSVQSRITEKVHDLLKQRYSYVLKTLSSHFDLIAALGDALAKRGTLYYIDINRILMGEDIE